MTDALQGISEDVPFDFEAAETLATACDNAATLIDTQSASRKTWVATAMGDFKGYFSHLFQNNATTASGDATELANALRATARGARKLATDARAEQKRREDARKWKEHHDHRNIFEKGWDGLTGGDDCPIPKPSPTLHYAPEQPATKPRQTPSPGSMHSGGGTSSARPEDLRTFANNSAAANTTLKGKQSTAKTAYSHFVSKCKWGSLSADGVFTGFAKWMSENDNDVLWARTVANAFAKAGGEGAVSTLSNSAIDASLRAAGVDETRDDLTIQMPSALGHPPTTGYANDPVNTSTGNFIETEMDLQFLDSATELSWSRSYNSVSRATGAFGPGWSSWTDAGLAFDDEAAHFTTPDGRQLTFPRLGEGWDRAIGESMWLTREDAALVVTDNQGNRWVTNAGGRLLAVDRGPGTRVSLEWSGDRLVGLAHARGRSIAIVWDEEAGHIVRVESSDGRTIAYGYDEAGRLVSATGPLGTRAYRWNDEGLIAAVIDADGVVEAENTYDEFGRVLRQRSPFGRVTRFVYLPGRVTVVSDENGERSNTWIADAAGRLVGVVDADEQRASFAYDAHGNPVLATERDGSTTITEYDARGRKIRQVLPSGADLTFAYDEADRVVRVDVASGGTLTSAEDSGVSVTTYEYAGEERNPSVIVDPEGGRTELVWESGLLRQVTDPEGVVVRFEHDDHGDLVATVDAEGNAARLERDGAGRVTAAITPSGARTDFAYHEGSDLLASRTDPDGATWAYEYTVGGRLAATVDPTGARTTIEHDEASGEASRTVDPLGRAVSRGYDDLGNVCSMSLPDGSTWRFNHDALSRLREVSNPAGGTTTTEYDAIGAPTRITEPTGAATEIAIDQTSGRVTSTDGVASIGAEVDRLGRLVGEARPDGSTVLTRYDRCGRPIEVVDPAGGLTRLVRDAAGRVTTLVRPSGAEIGYTYDACGRVESVTDPTGGATRYRYDVDGRVIEEISPTGESSTSRYDDCGRLVARRLPGVGTYTYAYDACGRVIESRDPANGRRRFGYDAAGQLVRAVDGNGGTTTYAYDANGRCVAITHPDGGVTRREFDANNRCTAETDPLGRTTMAGYDAAGRQIWQVDPAGRRTEWTYDERTGLRESLRVDGVEISRIERDLPGRRVTITDRANPSGEVTVHELTWDNRGLLTSRSREGRRVSWSYDANGACTSVTTPDDHTTSYARDAAGRLLGVSHPLLGSVIIERDQAGRPISARAGDKSQHWAYTDGYLTGHSEHDGDRLVRSEIVRGEDGRIEAVTIDRGDGAAVSTSYSYDDACQLIASTVGAASVRWSYDSAGRLVREAYSADGLQTSRQFEYDVAGQLQTITVGGSVLTSYTYDAVGRRTGESNADGSHRTFGWSPAGWLSSLTERDRRGQARTTDIVVDALGELAWIDDTEFFSDTADPYAGIIGVGGESIAHAGLYTGTAAGWSSTGWREARAVSTDPWQLPALPDPEIDPPAFQITPTGALLIGGHAGAGDPLEWLVNRVYDPATRAFCSVDPMAPTAGAGWAANPYSYAGNDPLHALDPLGLHPVTDAELRAYNANNGGLIAGAGHWLKNNWEYVAGAAMVIGGGIMIATGFGGPLGMMMVSAGASTLIQKATTGHVNWGEVAISGALGGIGGGAATLAARASEGGVMALRTTVLVNGGVGAVGSDAVYAYRVATGQQDFSAQGLIGNTIAGGVAGGLGGAAGPTGGTIAKELGATSTGVTAKVLTAGGNFAAGFTGDVTGAAMTGQPIDLAHAAKAGAFTAGSGALVDKGMDLAGAGSRGTTTLNQLSHFGPRTPSGAFNFHGQNTRAMWGSAGAGAALGFAGP